MRIRHLASKYFVHYGHMCFLFIWTVALDPLWTLNMYFFIIIVKNVYRHALKCTVTFIHCENICENKRFTFIQFLCPQYFQPTARFPTTHTFVKYVPSQLNITWPAQCTVHNAVHRVHKNLCNLGTFLIWILRHAQCSALHIVHKYLSWHFLDLDTLAFIMSVVNCIH